MAGKNVLDFTTANFDAEVLKADVPVLVDFTATWCGPCKALAPIVEKLADEFEGKVKVGKLDIDAASEVAAKYNVRSVPTVIVFRGGKPSGSQIGLSTRDKLVKLLALS
jgi:thioredoxin 1